MSEEQEALRQSESCMWSLPEICKALHISVYQHEKDLGSVSVRCSQGSLESSRTDLCHGTLLTFWYHLHSDYDAVSAQRDGLIAERNALVSERDELRDKLTECEETFKALAAERDALIADRDSLTRKIKEYRDAGRVDDCQSLSFGTLFPVLLSVSTPH